MSREIRSRHDQPKPKRRYEPPAIRREQEFERVAIGCNFYDPEPFGTCGIAGSS